MSNSKGLRFKKSMEVKQAFFDAAMALFRENGFEETSVDEIAERAGYSRATFFNHFGTKKGVLRFYGDDIHRQVQESVENMGPDAAPLHVLKEILLIMAHETEAHRQDLLLVFRYSIKDPDYMTNPTSARRAILNLVTSLLQKAQKAGEIRSDLPAFELAFHVMALYQGAALAVMAGLVEADRSITSIWTFLQGGMTGEITGA